MESTAYPQVMYSLVNILTLGINTMLMVLMLKGFARIRDLIRTVNETKLDISDLTERFTSYQKREGMRAARAVKTSEADMTLELQSLAKGVVGGSEPEDVKTALRRKLRGGH